MNSCAIQTDKLTRYFGSKCVVDQVTFAVPRGSVFALLGRNGSGKTTLVRMLLGVLDPTRGCGEILGEDICDISPPRAVESVTSPKDIRSSTGCA